jgi:hypothetical protein
VWPRDSATLSKKQSSVLSVEDQITIRIIEKETQ